ncbi:hypothetical protein GCM10027049_01630 [Mucilaginibacter puniceus]
MITYHFGKDKLKEVAVAKAIEVCPDGKELSLKLALPVIRSGYAKYGLWRFVRLLIVALKPAVNNIALPVFKAFSVSWSLCVAKPVISIPTGIDVSTI